MTVAHAAAATNKKTSQQNPFANHQRSVKVSDDVSWQDKIGLHQCDNYLGQVKINVTTVSKAASQLVTSPTRHTINSS